MSRTSRRWALAAVPALALGTFAATATPASAAQLARLTGEQQVGAPGDRDGTGTARISVQPGAARVCYEIRVQRIVRANMAHIHEGMRGENGPVVVPLGVPDAGGVARGCTNPDPALVPVLRDIARNPSHYYVNVHNAVHPAGAVRGQLARI